MKVNYDTEKNNWHIQKNKDTIPYLQIQHLIRYNLAKRKRTKKKKMKKLYSQHPTALNYSFKMNLLIIRNLIKLTNTDTIENAFIKPPLLQYFLKV